MKIIPTGPTQFRLAILFLLLGITFLLTALAFQHLGGYIPCRLCLEQREPYYTSLPIVLVLALLAARRDSARPSACLVRGLFLVVGLFMLYGAITGFYQAGAEWGLWPGPADCAGGDLPTSATSLIDRMNATRIVPCDKAAIRILGLSFAGWNVLGSGLLALIALLGAVLPAALPRGAFPRRPSRP